MNMCVLEIAMCEKCRSSHFQSEGGVKIFRTVGLPFFFGGSVPHYIPWLHFNDELNAYAT